MVNQSAEPIEIVFWGFSMKVLNNNCIEQKARSKVFANEKLISELFQQKVHFNFEKKLI